MSANKISLDRSTSNTVVITCSGCPFWSAIRYGMTAAHECAVNHEKTYHPGIKQARKAAWAWHDRHPATRR